jgi:Domain of Unknown Function (DUF1206)
MATSSHSHWYAARRTARGETVRALGRAGFVARGIVYLLVGWITVLIAVQHNNLQADRTGALELVAGKPFGSVVLWFLVVGFAGMALWRLSMAAYPQAGKSGAGSRIASLARAVLYAAACASTLSFLLTRRISGSTDQTSRDFTARAMKHAGGTALVALVGVALIIGGLAFIWRGVTRRFAKNLQRSKMSAKQWRWTLRLGAVGNCARGIVIAAAGGFMLDAALTFNPAQAKGADSTLRSFAAAPYGPVLLILMAIGLATFGAYSWCEARWRRI